MRALVLLNKVNLSTRQTQETQGFCASRGVEVVARVPFDTTVTEAIVHGQPVTAYGGGIASRELRLAWQRIKSRLELTV